MKKNLPLSRLMILIAVFFIGSSMDLQAGILTHPSNKTLCNGATGTVNFSVTTSIGIYFYQWQIYNKYTRLWEDAVNTTTGVVISGATTNTISFAFSTVYRITSTYNGMQVRCKVSAKIGSEYSNTATATVLTAASVTIDPVPATRIVGESVTFSVTASGSSPQYQWQKNSVSIDGANSSTYTIASVASGDAASYRCMVSNYCATDYSAAVALAVWPQLGITKQPVAVSACDGSTGKSFSVTAVGDGLTYQWQKKYQKDLSWSNISGATLNTFYLPALTTIMSHYYYRCIVTGNGGLTVTSNSALLTVYSSPAITDITPSNIVKTVGESVTFSVSASGSLLQYIWRKNGVDIAGATSSSYTIPSLILTDQATYSCKVYNDCNVTGVFGPNHVLNVETPAPDAWYIKGSPSLADIYSISAPTVTNVFAVQNSTDLIKTVNGGIDWTTITPPAPNTSWRNIDFISATTGLVAGYNLINRTTDGGTNWTSYNISTGLALVESPSVNSLQMVNASVVYAVGSKGLIMRSDDGGVTWTKQNYNGSNVPTLSVDLFTVSFSDANNGWAAGLNGVIVRTTNGGTNWALQKNGVNFWTPNTIYGIAAVTSTTGFLLTSSGNLMKTIDGGTNWTAVTYSPLVYSYSYYGNPIKFVDANNGYIVGYKSGSTGVVLKTNDGGNKWYQQTTEGNAIIHSIDMVNATDGWISGKGQVHRTSKGGCKTPGINLGADQTVCAGNTVLLTANSNPNNFNSSYLWTPGNISNSGTLSVSTTNTYGVTATNECGMTATDNVLVTFNPLPAVSAGRDTAICMGQTTQLNATGAESYSWTNVSFLDNPAVPNPIVNTGSTLTFTVTGTDLNGCSASDPVVVTVNPIPASTFTAPEFVCNTLTGNINYTGGAAGSKIFAWDFDGGVIQSGSGIGPYVLKWADLGDKSVSLTVTDNGCTSSNTMNIVNVRQTPTSTFQTPTAVCGNNGTSLFYTGNASPGASYSWGYDGAALLEGTGQGPLLVAWATKGIKNVSLSITDNGCASATTNQNVLVAYPYEGSQICMVTIDLETERNMVVWLKTPGVGIASYNVYREDLAVAGQYDLLGNVPYNELTVFVDTSSRPSTRQYLYKIAAVDTCGNVSSLSSYHKTSLLQWSSNGSVVNLNWQKYEIQGAATDTYFPTYQLWRGTLTKNVSLYKSISSSVSAIIDDDPLSLVTKKYYRVAAVRSSQCAPAEAGKKASSGPYVHSLSNLEDNRLQGGTGISEKLADALKLSIYPNPFSEISTISYYLQKPTRMKVEIYNLLGESVKVILDENQNAGNHKLEMKASDVDNNSGLYYLRILVDGEKIVRKTMLTR